jgi:hypothetical protein
MSDFNKLMLLVGVLFLISGVFSLLGGAPVPGGFFILCGLLAVGGTMAANMGLADQLNGDFDQMVGTAGFGAAMGIGLAWLGLASVAFGRARTGGMEGHPDAQLWWGIIGTFLAIAALGALFGGFIHFRQQRN